MSGIRSLLFALAVLLSVPPLAAQENRKESDDEVFTVGEVVVTSRRAANMERAGTTTIITGEDVKERDEQFLDETLEMVPGVQVYTHTKGHRRIRMRGFDQDYVVVLVDGIPINDLYSTDVDISSIPVMNIARIVVNRGASSALYGTDGAIGSVNVVTRRPTRRFANTSLRFGPYDNRTVSVATGAPLGRFYYWVNASADKAGGFAPSARLDRKTRRAWFDKAMRYDLYGYTFDEVAFPAKEQYLNDTGRWDHQELNTCHLSAKVGYEFVDGWEVGLTGAFFSREGMTNTYQARALSDYNLANEKWRVNRRPHFLDDFASVKDFALRNRAFVWPENWRVTVSPYLTGEVGDFSVRLAPFFFLGHARQEGYATTDHTLTKGTTALYTDRRDPDAYDPFHDIKTYGSYGFRLLPSYEIGDHRLSLGINWRTDLFIEEGQAVSPSVSPHIVGLVGSGTYPVSDLSAQRLSLALEYEAKLFDRLKVAAGVSYDAQSLGTFKVRNGLQYGDRYVPADKGRIWGTRDSFNPVAGLVYDAVRRRLRFRVAGNIKSRFPTLSDYDKVADESLDTGLKPERSYNINAGVEAFFLDQALSVRSDFFHSTVDDRIVRVNKDDPPVNVERMTMQGVESIVTGKVRGIGGVVDLEGSVSHTYVHSRNHDDSLEETVNMGDWVEFSPEHHVTADLRLNFRWGTGLTVWGTFVHGAHMYVMQEAPEEFAAYSTDYFTTLRLHDPLFLNLKLSQRVLSKVELYVLARNLLDDYGMDPFVPGAGRMVYFGVAAEW